MNRLLSIAAALALVLGLSQCRKPNAPTINGIGETQHVTLTSSFGGDGSKLDVQTVSGSLNLKWQVDDKINILSPNSGQLNCTSVSEDGKTGTFDGVITRKSGDITFAFGAEPDYMKQDGGEITEDDIYLVGTSEYKSDGKYENVPMELPYAVLKLDLSYLGSSTKADDGATVTVKVGDSEIAKIINVKSSSTEMYVALPIEGESTEKAYEFSSTNGKTITFNWTLDGNTFFTADGSNGNAIVIAPESGPEGLCFTANAAGTISMKNWGTTGTAPDLQYSTDNGATWTVWSDVTAAINVEEGDKFYVKAGETGNTSIYPYAFQTTGGFKVSGNIMYLLDKNPSPTATLQNDCFAYLFFNSPEYNIYNSITDASELQLPDVTSSYCYYEMFWGCTSLTAAPALPATTLAVGCYYGMFYGCTSLTAAPALPATTLANYCYYYMFVNCTSLNAAPALPAETLAYYCYYCMFYGCTSLNAAPALPATTLADNCYNCMFYGCTCLTTAPALPAETLAGYCYSSMFQGCTSLTAAPALPAETLAESCYSNMFKDCTSLAAAPELPAETLVDYCYGEMFSGCSNLTSVTMLATDVSATECLVLWLDGAGTGEKKVYINGDASDETKTIIEQNSTGWDVVRLGSEPEGLCFTANEAGTISMMEFNLEKGIGEFGMGEVKDATVPDLQYSTDNGATWTVWSDVTAAINVEKGDKFYVKAGESGNTSINPYIFQTTGDFKVSGNIMYLLDNDLTPEPTMGKSCFGGLFMNLAYYNYCNSITDASELQLPETTSDNCYASMFVGCKNLTAAPALPAETLAEYCYASMFAGCTSLTAAPALPAETLAGYCYYLMFNNCKNLTAAPALPAETLEESCYYMMFGGCSNLTSVTMLATNVSADGCLGWWLEGAGTSATNQTVYVANGDMKTTVEGTLDTSVWNVVVNSK